MCSIWSSWKWPQRFWVGASRDMTAESQYDITWVNGKKELLDPFVWHISEEQPWKRKCLTSFFSDQNIGYRMLLYLVECYETRYLDNVICEKAPPRLSCSSSSDCHQLADCFGRHCLCQSGYAGDGRNCFDMNECEEGWIDFKDLTKPGENLHIQAPPNWKNNRFHFYL